MVIPASRMLGYYGTSDVDIVIDIYFTIYIFSLRKKLWDLGED